MGEESKDKKIIGPDLPPGYNRSSNATSASDKATQVNPKRVFGPSRPPVESKDTEEYREKRSRSRSPPSHSSNEKSLTSKREQWMTDIDNSDNLLKLDPLNIKPRTFIQKRTETSSNRNEQVNPEIKAQERELDEHIKKYNETHRQKTLQEVYEEQHMNEKKTKTELDRQERIFDWERDMNSTVRQMSSKSAKELVNKSNLNDRFSSSTSKKYL